MDSVTAQCAKAPGEPRPCKAGSRAVTNPERAAAAPRQPIEGGGSALMLREGLQGGPQLAELPPSRSPFASPRRCSGPGDRQARPPLPADQPDQGRGRAGAAGRAAGAAGPGAPQRRARAAPNSYSQPARR